MSAQKVDTRIDFRSGTRQRRKQLDTRTFSAGNSITPVRLDKVGYLSRIFVRFNGTVDSSGAITAAKDNPWSIIKRLKVSLNSGAQNIVDISGFGLFVMNHFLNDGYSPNDGGGGNNVVDTSFYNYDLNNADETNALTLAWEVPIAANYGENFQVGLLMMQAPELEGTLEIDFGSNAEYGTAITAIAGTLEIVTEYYDVPNPALVRLPPPQIHRLVEETYPITGTGETKIDLKRQGVLLQLAAIVELNGARNHTDVETSEITLNESDRLYKEPTWLMRFLQRREKGVGFPTGVLSYDFWNAHGMVSSGDSRDAIDTEAIALTTLKFNVASGATLGANNNQVRVIRRLIQDLR